MWQVDNRTPFAADRGWVRDRDGAEIWLVAVKATFDILPDGSVAVSDQQPPVLRMPEYLGEPGNSSIRYDADLVLTKTTTDVIVVGHAYAPRGEPVAYVSVGFKVGPVQKVLRVVGDRHWSGSKPSAPQPFERMPLTYEAAFGGVDKNSEAPGRDFEWRNPVGKGFAMSANTAAGLALPNIEDPKAPILSWSDHPAPAGFGAICSHWQPRVGYAGTYDDRWMNTRQPLLAADLDDRFFQSAPIDQQAPYFLRGGEPVVLQNLTPGGLAKFFLPRLFLNFETLFYDGTRELHRERRLHTVILEPDIPRVSLVWHTTLPCHFKVQKLDRTVIALKSNLRNGESSMSTAMDQA